MAFEGEEEPRLKNFFLRNEIFKFWLVASLSLYLIINSTGCKTNADDAASTSGNGGTSLPSGQIAPVGAVSSSGFFVQAVMADSSIRYYLHEQSVNPLTTGFTCMVSQANATSTGSSPGSWQNDDIVCILDVNELDLFANAIVLNYNSPTGMCPYTYVMPYAFYEDLPGNAGNVSLAVTKNAAGVVTAVAATPATGDVTVDPAGNPICSYDYSANNPAGPNCCIGTWTMATTQGATTTNTSGTFSGTPSNCLVGPAMDTQTKDTYGNPLTSIYYTYTSGVNGSYTIASSKAKGYKTPLYAANFFNPWDINAAAINANTAGAHAFPANDGAAFQSTYVPISLRNTGSQVAAQPYYEFGCVDAAADYIARIRVIIRAWDTVSRWTAYSNPYMTGSSTFNANWHTYDIWRDVIFGWGSYGSGGTRSLGTVAPAAAAYGTGTAASSPAAATGFPFTAGTENVVTNGGAGTQGTGYPHYSNF